MVLYSGTAIQLTIPESWNGYRHRIKLQAESRQFNPGYGPASPSVSVYLIKKQKFRGEITHWTLNGLWGCIFRVNIDENKKARRRPYSNGKNEWKRKKKYDECMMLGKCQRKNINRVNSMLRQLFSKKLWKLKKISGQILKFFCVSMLKF